MVESNINCKSPHWKLYLVSSRIVFVSSCIVFVFKSHCICIKFYFICIQVLERNINCKEPHCKLYLVSIFQLSQIGKFVTRFYGGWRCDSTLDLPLLCQKVKTPCLKNIKKHDFSFMIEKILVM